MTGFVQNTSFRVPIKAVPPNQFCVCSVTASQLEYRPKMLSICDKIGAKTEKNVNESCLKSVEIYEFKEIQGNGLDL